VALPAAHGARGLTHGARWRRHRRARNFTAPSVAPRPLTRTSACMSIEIVRYRIAAGDEAAFEAAYAEVTRKVKGTPGHIHDELLRSEDRPDQYILLSEWESKEAFLAWENAPVHTEKRNPMTPYWAGKVERIIWDVAHTIKAGA
jgi:heme-degrading monooxygenase HmoA